MKVLVGIDGSDRSYHALRYASSLLSAKADSLLLCFSPPTFQLASNTELPANVGEQASDALATVIFDRAKKQLSPAMQSVTRTLLEHGKPVEGLLAASEREDVDLIVVGAHGAKRTLSFFLGGTARAVAHHATKPVLVVRGEADPRGDEMRVLIACDQDRWQSAANVLQHLSWPKHTRATLFHVVESLDDQHVHYLSADDGSTIPHAQKLLQACRETAERNKEERARQLQVVPHAGPSILRGAEVEVAQGHAAEKIIQKVECDGTDLVVVGARTLGPLGRLLGSTTEALLIRCPCSLLIVHDQAGIVNA
jgi:nucleotide-binding universal stress UspA family protein